MLLSVWWSARGALGQLINISEVSKGMVGLVRMVLWIEKDDNIREMREAVISGAGEKELHGCGRTPENVVLVVLVGFGSHFD